MGLDASPTLIRGLLSDPNRDKGTEIWGTPVSAAERDELQTRLDIGEAMGTVQNYGEGPAADDYAGTWVDQEHGGLVYAAFTRNVASHTSALSGIFPFASRLRTVEATYSLNQLDAKTDQVESDRGLLSAQGVDIVGAGPDVESNRVEVEVANATSTTETILTNRFGPMVKRANGEAARTKASIGPKDNGRIPPVYGGFKLFRTDGGGTRCSAAFSAYRNFNGRRHNYLMTAGHCGGRNRTFYHGALKFVGHMKFSQFRENQEPGNVDVGYLGLPNRRYGTYSVWGNHSGDLRPIKGFDRYPRNKDDSKPPQTYKGDPVCLSGAEASYLRCGKVVKPTDAHTFDGEHLHSVVKFYIYGKLGACGGDSGGALISGTRAVGLLTGGSDEVSKDRNCGKTNWATQIQHALNRFPSAEHPARLVLKR